MQHFVLKQTEHSAKLAGDKEFLFEQLRLMHENLTAVFSLVEDGKVLTMEDVGAINHLDDIVWEALGEFSKWYTPAVFDIVDHIEACEVKEPMADAS